MTIDKQYADAAEAEGADEYVVPLIRRKRFQAKVIDLVIMVVPWLAFFFGAWIMLSAERLISERCDCSTWRYTAFDVLFGACFAYPVAIIVLQGTMLIRRGQTLGKRASNLAVTLPDGTRAGFTRAVLWRSVVPTLLFGSKSSPRHVGDSLPKICCDRS